MTRPKLLLADDSATIRDQVEQTFTGEGLDVITVTNGDDAMRKFVESRPDILILDVNMPEPTGYKICEIVKQDESTRHIPVILVVGSYEPFDQAEADRVGSDGVLTKPFQPISDLIARVEELLGFEKGTASPAETADIDDLYDSTFSESEDSGLSDVDLGGFNESDDGSLAAPDDSSLSEPDDGEFNEPNDISLIVPDESALNERHDNGLSETEARSSSEPELVEQNRPLEFDFSDAAMDDEIIEVCRPSVVTASNGDISGEATGGAAAFTRLDDAFAPPMITGSGHPEIDYAREEPSEEFIALVTQRVVEKLSDKVVREIARESVPKIAEKLIREALDEGKK